MITIADNKQGMFCPVALCDVCNNRIMQASFANVEFAYPLNNNIRIVHKKCSSVNKQLYDCYQSLDVYLANLLYNVNYKKPKRSY